MSPDVRRRTGDRGEVQARRYLERLGYRWLVSNWHCRAGELDIVMLDDHCLVFVEVKTRRTLTAGRAEESISSRKATRLLKAAEWFVASHPSYQDMVWRCDLVAIQTSPQGEVVVSHYENAVVAG